MKPLNQRPLLYWMLFAVLIFFVLLMNLSSVSPVRSQGDPTPTPTSARFATMMPTPLNNGGSATWTVKKMTLVSDYPKGFDFILDATSSAGKIILASVYWRHSTIQPVTLNAPITNSGPLQVHWAMTPMQPVPGWVGVDYWWVLTDEHGNMFETPHGYAEYADTTRKWKRLVSEDAVIHWDASLPDEVGPDVAAALKAQRDKYLHAWGRLLDYKPQIIIYKDFKAWQEWEPAVNSNSIDGETATYWGSTVQIYHPEDPDPVKRLTYGVVLHEVEHLYQQTFSPYETYLKMVWFYEGDAAYMELHPYYDYVQKVRDMAAAGQLPALEREPALRLGDRLAYDVGCAFWKYLEVTFGPDMHRQVWKQIAIGLPIQGALKAATGKDFPDLEAGFRAWVGAKPLSQ